MSNERSVGVTLTVRYGGGLVVSKYGGSFYIPDASQRNRHLSRVQENEEREYDRQQGYALKKNYNKRLSIRQQLLTFQQELKKVTYLDGDRRGKPQHQWDTRFQRLQRKGTASYSDKQGRSATTEFFPVISRSGALGLSSSCSCPDLYYHSESPQLDHRQGQAADFLPVITLSRSKAMVGVKEEDTESSFQGRTSRKSSSDLQNNQTARARERSVLSLPARQRRMSRSLTDISALHGATTSDEDRDFETETSEDEDTDPVTPVEEKTYFTTQFWEG